jgi:hypothetical protein
VRVIYQSDLDDLIAFKERAKEKFMENKKWNTYSDKSPETGSLFAIRWGVANQAILVFKISDSQDPIIFGDELPEGRDGD